MTTVMNIDVYETYDMTTGEMLGSDEDYASRRPLRTNRTVECRKCGRHYRIDDEVYEMVKW